jgi:hypothetical protein
VAKLNRQEIRKRAIEIVARNPGGIRYSALVEAISNESPETPRNTIHGSVWNLAETCPTEITKPSRGLFKPKSASEAEAVVVGETEQTASTGKKIRESDFYEPFAEWLKNELGEVTEVASLGGAGMKSKWATPDVVGVYKPLAKDRIKFPLEIVSAEIKIDPQAPVVAFGQAVAYRLFSAKTYIAMPISLGDEDRDRLESLCMLFGVGLALFDVNEPSEGNSKSFSILVRAQRFSPDMFYVNAFANRLIDSDPDVFEKLFRGI